MISKKRRLDLPPQHTLEDRAVTFITRPDADPNAGGHRPRARHAFGGHRQAVVERRDP